MGRLSIICVLLAPAVFGAGEVDKARQLFARAQYREVLQVLNSYKDTSDPSVFEWTGRAWFMLADYKKAAEAFEKAVALRPQDSRLHHWLGKAYGRRAETSNPLSAPILAGKARQSFEKAVALDPKNGEALNDLFSYYLEAPGFLGGGIDKAAALASRIEAIDKAEYHYALAQVADKRKEFKTAEFHFRQAFEMAPKQVGRAIDLARFLSRQGRVQESEAVISQAEQISPNVPRLLFERASLYIQARKNLAAAKALLQRYLSSPLTPDDPPRAEAERLLKQATSLGA